MSDLLPSNATPAERALSETLARTLSVPTPVRDVWNPATCPASVLPWLAWAFSVDNWDPAWTDAQKRQTIATSVAIHRYKGTIGAVREVIAALGVNCQIQEWFNQSPPGAPYTFRLILDADQGAIPQPVLAKLIQVVTSTKNLRSHLDAVVPGVTSEARIYVGAVANLGSEITVHFDGEGGLLVMDGTFVMDGTYRMNGLKVAA